jgi:hypothetical protein
VRATRFLRLAATALSAPGLSALAVTALSALVGLIALPAAAALPDAASRRYRMEIGGDVVGVAMLSVRCERGRCTGAFETAMRLPEAGGGGVTRRRVEVVTDREGRLLEVEAGGKRRPAGGEAVASIVAEALLAATPEGERRCLDVEDAELGRQGRACATRRGAWLDGDVLGEPVRFRASLGGLPDEVLLPSQGTRFVVDAAAVVPARAPTTFGGVVPAPPGAEVEQALLFCGLPPEPVDPSPPPVGLPRDFPERGGCQERSAAYLRAAKDDGLSGRLVVGVAWDGARFVWHEWVEVATARRWIAVDPSFRQVPAQAPRFAVARFDPGDEAGRAEAGRKVLACWGKARVVRAGPAR